MKDTIKFLCKSLDVREDKLQDEIRKLESTDWSGVYDKEEKEEANREIGYKKGQREAYIEIREVLEEQL